MTTVNREPPRGWLVVPFLLGAASAGLQVTLRITEDYGSWGIETDPGSVLFMVAPFLVTVAAIGAGCADPRRSARLALVVLALVGPAWLLLQVISGRGGLEPMRGLFEWIVMPASVGAAAGLLGGLQRRAIRSYGALAIGAVIGFLLLAVPLNLLGVGGWAECTPPGSCDVLQMVGLVGRGAIVGLIGVVILTPAFLVGALIGRLAPRPGERPQSGAPRLSPT